MIVLLLLLLFCFLSGARMITAIDGKQIKLQIWDTVCSRKLLIENE